MTSSPNSHNALMGRSGEVMELVSAAQLEEQPGAGALQSDSRAHVPDHWAVFPPQVERNRLGKSSMDLESDQIPLWLLPGGTGRGAGPEAGPRGGGVGR